jgi:acyl-lipid omega-6 desaturase (Delta-12 desaturase)
MHERELNVRGMPDSCAWARILGRYRESSCARGVFELVITAVPFVLLWILMWTTLATGYWIFATGGASQLRARLPAAKALDRLVGQQAEHTHHDGRHASAAGAWSALPASHSVCL